MRVAQEQLGLAEVPDGCNCGPQIQKFLGSSAGEAWCADFVSWVYREAGHPFSGGVDGGWRLPGVAGLHGWLRANGIWHDRGGGDAPRPGDVIVFRDDDHVGIVEAVDGATVRTSRATPPTTSAGAPTATTPPTPKILGWGRMRAAGGMTVAHPPSPVPGGHDRLGAGRPCRAPAPRLPPVSPGPPHPRPPSTTTSRPPIDHGATPAGRGPDRPAGPDRLERDHRLAQALPHATAHYRIDFTVGADGRLRLTVTLLVVLNSRGDLAGYQADLRRYKAEALEFIGAQGDDPASYTLRYLPPEAAAL